MGKLKRKQYDKLLEPMEAELDNLRVSHGEPARFGEALATMLRTPASWSKASPPSAEASTC